MLATALAVCACRQGRRVRFTTLAGLANELLEAESRRELGRVVGRYARTELVVLDELGYLALPDGAAELIFQVISERNERGSPRRSSTASPTRLTSSRRAPSPGAFAMDWRNAARRRKEAEEGRAGRRHRSASPFGRRLRVDGLTAHRTQSDQPNNWHGVGPVQVSNPGPLQVATLRRSLLPTHQASRRATPSIGSSPPRRSQRASRSSPARANRPARALSAPPGAGRPARSRPS